MWQRTWFLYACLSLCIAIWQKKAANRYKTIFSQIFAVDLVGQEHFGFWVIFGPNHWCQDVFCGNEPHVCGCNANSVLLAWEILLQIPCIDQSCGMALEIKMELDFSNLPRWVHMAANMVQYHIAELQVAPLTLAKCELEALANRCLQEQVQVGQHFLWSIFGFQKEDTFWKQIGLVQCHFLINGVSKALAKWSMACSMAAKRLALVVTPAWLPSCTWFIAMASKAWHSAGQWLRGWTTVWTKCLTTGNVAKISDACKEIFGCSCGMLLSSWWSRNEHGYTSKPWGNGNIENIFPRKPMAGCAPPWLLRLQLPPAWLHYRVVIL